MAGPSKPQDAVLYQNPSKTVVLLDIPRSISLAQGTQSHPYTGQICSSTALQTPYLSTEPKTDKAKAKLQDLKRQERTDLQFPEHLLQQALDEISSGHDGMWCLERKLVASTAARQNKKRNFDEESAVGIELESARSQQSVSGVSRRSKGRLELPMQGLHHSIDLSASINAPDAKACLSMRQIANKSCYNPSPHHLILQDTEYCAETSNVYLIPPHASFLLSKIDQETAPVMSMATLMLYPEPSATADRGQFDIILLDPPWPNRSAKRAAKYEIMKEQEPMEVLQGILSQHIAPNGLVACWITHKASARNAALEAFETWDVQLVEEWAWLKVTANGEPVTEITGLWRKPYEILLLGRKRTSGKGEGDLKRRVIVGVPDFHSRKPNLKALIESGMPEQYRALEIFARNLTAEWCAWGDEVLKYSVLLTST